MLYSVSLLSAKVCDLTDGMSRAAFIPAKWIEVKKQNGAILTNVDGLRQGSEDFPLSIPLPVDVVFITIRLSETTDVAVKSIDASITNADIAWKKVKNSTMDEFVDPSVSLFLIFCHVLC